MAGNIAISSSATVPYNKLEPGYNYSPSVGEYLYFVNTNINLNEYYDFGRLDSLKITVNNMKAESADKVMFDFTANRENVIFSIVSSAPIYWNKELSQFKVGYRYQVLYFRGIVSWTEIEME